MKRYIAEFLGTMFLVVIGCGVAVYTNANVVATSLAFGLSIVVLANSISSVSGCHINPAVSFGMLLAGRMSLIEFLFYCLSQCLGAIAGAGILALFFNGNANLGANGAGGNILVAFLVETLLTYLFVSVVIHVTANKTKTNTNVGLIIGLALVLVHLFGIGFTGTSVNPARSLGPALIQGGQALKDLWIFILAPLVGSFLAALTNKLLVDKD